MDLQNSAVPPLPDSYHQETLSERTDNIQITELPDLNPNANQDHEMSQ